MALWTIILLPALAGLTVLASRRRLSGTAAALIGAAASLSAAMVCAWAALPLTGWVAVTPAMEAASTVLVTATGAVFRERSLGAWFDTGEMVSSVSVRLDALSAAAILLVSLVGAVLLAHAAAWRGRQRDPAVIGGVILLLSTLCALLLAADLIVLVAAWQLLSMISFVLLASEPELHVVARRALAAARFGGAALLLAALALAWGLGTLRMGDLADRAVVAWAPGEPQALLIALLLLGAALSAAAVVPCHAWLAGAAGARWLVAAVHLTVLPVAGVYLLARFQTVMVLGAAALALAAGLGAVTALSAGLAALGQRRPRDGLAFGTVAQYGLVVAAIGAGGFVAGVVHMAMTVLFVAGLMIALDLVSAGGPETAEPTGGRVSRQLAVTAMALVGAAAWAGVPLLTATTASREAVLWAVLRPPIGTVSLWAAALVAVAIGAFAAVRWLLREFWLRPVAETTNVPRWVNLAPGLTVAAATVLAGLAGIARSEGVEGLLVRMQRAALTLPANLTIGSAEDAAWLTPAAAASLRPNLAVLAVAVVGLGAGVGLLFYWVRPDLRRRLQQIPLLANLHKAAAAGWYVNEASRSLLVRPWRALAYLLRDRGPSADDAVPAGAGPWCVAWRPVVAALLMPSVFVFLPGTPSHASLLLVPVATVLVTAVVSLRSRRVGLWFGLIGSSVQLALLLAAGRSALVASRSSALGNTGASVELLGLLLALFAVACSVLALLFLSPVAPGWRRGPALLLATAGAVQATLLVDDLVVLVLLWGAAVGGLILLLGAAGDRQGPTAWFTPTGGWVCLAVATGWLMAGRTSVDGIVSMPLAQLGNGAVGASGNEAIAVLYLVGFAALGGLFPLHSWFLRAQRARLTPIAVLLVGTWSMAAIYGLIRVVPVVFPGYWVRIASALAFTGLVGALVAATAALGQRSLRGVVGYAALWQTSMAMIGLAAWSMESVQGSVFLLLGAALVGSGLHAAGALRSARGSSDVFGEGAELDAVPRPSVAMSLLLVGAAASAGSGSFIGMVLVSLGSFREFPATVAAALAGSVGLAIVLAHVHHRTSGGRSSAARSSAARSPAARSPGSGERLVLGAVLVVVFGIGLYPQPVLDMAATGIGHLMAREIILEPVDPEIGLPNDRRVTALAESAEQVAQKEQ